MKPNKSHIPLVKPIFLHGVMWAILATLVFYAHPPVNPDGPLGRLEERLTWLQLISLATLILLFYINAFWLIPSFFRRGKILVFVLVQIGLNGIFIALEYFFFDHVVRSVRIPPMPFPSPFPGGDRVGASIAPAFRLPPGTLILPVLLTFAASMAYRYIVDSLKESNRQKEWQMASLTSELHLLKSQVSPHFLFNVLNGLAFLARKKSESLEPALIKLSSLMRYMIYDAEGLQVLLKKEINYLNDYIDLQKMRYQELKINVSFIDDGSRLLIAPMILIPFVENAFKHAAGFVDDSGFIKIELFTKKNRLHFSVENKYTESKCGERDKASGIGLSNVSKRLQLIYPGTHTLEMEKIKDIFIVTLVVELQMAMQML